MLTDRDRLWADYYKAVRMGNQQLATRLLNTLHQPPSSLTRNVNSSNNCKSCRGRI